MSLHRLEDQYYQGAGLPQRGSSQPCLIQAKPNHSAVPYSLLTTDFSMGPAAPGGLSGDDGRGWFL